MMLSEEEREKLELELKGLTTPKPIMSLEDLKHVEERGAVLLTKLIDDDILKKVIRLGDKKI